MANPSFSLNLEFMTLTCYKCGITFGVPAHWKQTRREDHAEFWCPNGHGQLFKSESEAEKNARLLREEQARHQRTLALKNVAEAEAERLSKRVSRGSCPCCKRNFVNMQRHMKTKHPDFGKK